jgi:hypothetical protein
MPFTNAGPSTSSNPQPQAGVGNIQKSAILTASITPAAVAAATTAGQSFTLTGLGVVVGDQVAVSGVPAITPAGTFPIGANVTATDTVQIVWANVTAGSLTPPAGTYTFEVNRAQTLSVSPTGYMNSF